MLFWFSRYFLWGFVFDYVVFLALGLNAFALDLYAFPVDFLFLCCIWLDSPFLLVFSVFFPCLLIDRFTFFLGCFFCVFCVVFLFVNDLLSSEFCVCGMYFCFNVVVFCCITFVLVGVVFVSDGLWLCFMINFRSLMLFVRWYLFEAFFWFFLLLLADCHFVVLAIGYGAI